MTALPGSPAGPGGWTFGRLLRWAATAGWMTVIFLLSSVRGGSVPSPVPDYIPHAVEYAVLVVLLRRALENAGKGFSPRGAGLVSVIVSVLYAVSDEYHQSFVPGRDASIVDVGYDVVGIVAATVGVSLARRRRSSPNPGRRDP